MGSAYKNDSSIKAASRLDAASLACFHDQRMRERDWPVLSRTPARPGVWAWIDANHRYNGLLWREEERARRPEVPDNLPPGQTPAGTRLIDRYRQKRDVAILAIDEALLAALQGGLHAGLRGPMRPPEVLPSSETAGAIVDRLSVLALDIHITRTRLQELEAASEQAVACSARLERLLAQRHALGSRFDARLTGAGPQDGGATP